MAVKDGSGPRPAAQTAKPHCLNWLETSSEPCLCLPFCTASFQLACCVLQLAFVLHLLRLAAGFRLAQLGSKDRVAGLKHHGSEGRIRPAATAQTARRHCLNWLEASSTPCLCLPFCTASVQLACYVLQLARLAQLGSKDRVAGLEHNGSEGRMGPAASSPDCQTSLSELTRN